jgi:hypothetical protein
VGEDRETFRRRKAREHCEKVGGRWPCGFCGRPIGDAVTRKGPYAHFDLRGAQTNPKGRSRKRKLCYSCYWRVLTFVRTLEQEPLQLDLVPEVLVFGKGKRDAGEEE